ncbi:MAG: class SAM-dependent methyltransferase [Bacteroidetes bacterium]|nr:class SAM-dependent methyltransferase [Bacteroidota bacterium]
MRAGLFEFEDLQGFPAIIRQGMTDYLRFILNTADLYRPVTTLLAEGLEQTGSETVIDLCSGSGGAVEQVQKNICDTVKKEVFFVLTDKFPNVPTYKFLKKKTSGKISYSEMEVDAMDVPSNLKGFRTIFSGFHHFNLQQGSKVLKNAVEARQGIAIFDGGDKNLFIILAILVLHPLIFFFCTPFFRPFRISNIIFTYLIPLIPFCTIWDGIVSITRLYKPNDLLIMAQNTGPDYSWQAGKVKNKLSMNIAYLIGYPKNGEG